MDDKITIHQFSQHLFWDVDKTKLEMDKDAPYIIKNVLEYGLMNDWNLIKSYYTIPFIAKTAQTFRDLEPRACSFIAAISHTPITQFRCYTTQQSTPPHWNF